jgi:superfamily II DNA or RNA helicase
MPSLPDLSRLRSWQAEAITQYLTEYRKDFTVTATPGAGKTTFALTLAKHLLTERIIDRIIVVVPTDHLRTQWASAAKKLGIVLDPTLGNDSILKKEFNGYVTTYPQVASHPLLHQRRTELPRRSFVILDEIHHAGDGLSWGEAILEAFTPAERRLSLTGTPFRTSDKEKIPFVRYEDDEEGLRSVSDYAYGYREALDNNVVRPVMFAAYTGQAQWSNSAGEMAASLTDELTKDQEMQAWRTVLEPKGEWVAHVIGAAASRLDEMRSAGMHDAGMLILASDQESAKEYAKVVQSVTGVKPTLALSEDPKASSKISSFANSNDKYLVAVRMVSEGVDVPRLGVLVWLTSYRTPLFFAQAVGRVVRARRAGESATVFLPAVRPLLALAAEIETARDHVLYKRKQDEGLLEVYIDREQSEPTEPVEEFRALGSSAQFAHVVFSGKSVTGEAQQQPLTELSDTEIEELGLFASMPGLLSPEATANLLAQRDHNLRSSSGVFGQPTTSTEPEESTQALHEQLMALRREITSLVNRYSSRSSKQHSEVHMMCRRIVPGPSNADADLDVLTRRRDWLLTRIH